VTNFARRAATVGATLAAVTAATIGAASADDPTGWSNPSHVPPMHWLLVLLIIPLGAALVISFVVLLPGILRGEGLLPKPFKDTDESHGPSGH
jgi:hypothetical protein